MEGERERGGEERGEGGKEGEEGERPGTGRERKSETGGKKGRGRDREENKKQAETQLGRKGLFDVKQIKKNMGSMAFKRREKKNRRL